MERIGPLLLVEGRNKSKVPFSRSLYINCQDKVLIDTGAEPEALVNLKLQYGVDLIINTHYHPDHTLNNHLFKDTPTWINPIEFKTARSVDSIAKLNGIYQEWGPSGVELFRKSVPKEWTENLSNISGCYQYEKEYRFGDVNVIFLHTPGHTKGFSCPYFPDLGVVFVGDYDMTTFGPWYNGTDGDIEEFISSAKRLLSLDVDTYITGHQKGVFSKQEFHEAMYRYLEIINRRDQEIESLVKKGLNFNELVRIGIFYPKESLKEPIFQTWERVGIRKHLERLNLTVPGANNEYLITS
ncbi:MBL fold metallo-hydrolase [Bacillus sinesaloumensis]|uniref:MBL fold metallo-hydrolase n=1 Tax=Litchfieldia sinesaloumensis TaxID=1926280 RepID=UPI0009887C2F|nr:MBL fold metallo-hydrolase [Bacillus sinesaloumensis]